MDDILPNPEKSGLVGTAGVFTAWLAFSNLKQAESRVLNVHSCVDFFWTLHAGLASLQKLDGKYAVRRRAIQASQLGRAVSILATLDSR